MKRLVVLAFLVTALPASATTVRIFPSQDAWPVWSPGQGRIAFTRIEPNSMALEILTLGKQSTVVEVARSGGQLAPSWSSDGLSLAYAAGGRIYTVDGTGHGKHALPFQSPAYAPAYRPDTTQIAYLTSRGARNTDLWVDGTRWARDVVGRPAWNDTGTLLAVQRDTGVYVLDAAGSERKLASVDNPGPPVWHGADVFYPAGGRIWKVSAQGIVPPRPVAVTPRYADIASPTFDPDNGYLFYTHGGEVDVLTAPHESGLWFSGVGLGIAFAPPNSSRDTVFAFAGPHASCPAHMGLHLRRGPQLDDDVGVTGTCSVLGTPKADVIEGSPREGDVILAGAGNDRVHANDGHRDRVDCGPGRDTVWADRTDKLTGCEIVHR
ncbi:MAG: TolB family protein [Gaiellaceae bacterium]